MVFRHPLHAVSDAGRGYRIDGGVPVGKVRVTASHPEIPSVATTFETVVKVGEVSTINPDAGATSPRSEGRRRRRTPPSRIPASTEETLRLALLRLIGARRSCGAGRRRAAASARAACGACRDRRRRRRAAATRRSRSRVRNSASRLVDALRGAFELRARPPKRGRRRWQTLEGPRACGIDADLRRARGRDRDRRRGRTASRAGTPRATSTM